MRTKQHSRFKLEPQTVFADRCSRCDGPCQRRMSRGSPLTARRSCASKTVTGHPWPTTPLTVLGKVKATKLKKMHGTTCGGTSYLNGWADATEELPRSSVTR